MLPGFRFLFAAIMLSMSLLIFGLGAAALFRAAHESFASNSPWRATPDVPFAQRPETMLPMLATLRVEPVTDKANDAAKVAAAPAEPASSPVEPTMNDQVAALKAVDTPLVDVTKPESAVTDILGPQNGPAPEAGPDTVARAEPFVAASEAMTAAVPAQSADSTPAMAPPEPATTSAIPATADPTTGTPAATIPAMPAESIAAAKIATLGGPPVDIAPELPIKDKTVVKSEQATDDQSAVTKRVHARRAAHRRRLAARARLAAQQLLLQQQANPFAPAPVAATTTRQRQPQQ
jgi:hypothetical protein